MRLSNRAIDFDINADDVGACDQMKLHGPNRVLA